MDKELFELCKQVYEATGWGETLSYIADDAYKSNSIVVKTVYDRYVGLYDNCVGCDECEGDYLKKLTPIYTSDYLLEKLPKASLTYDELTNERIASHPVLSRVRREWADTPRKALLKLTLALKEAGVI